MRFSVIIPTYNRSEKLEACLKALFAQVYDKKNFEIIVVDDGSQDSTRELLEKMEKHSPVSLTILSQKNQGQGVARNFGMTAAQGEIILFLGDDIMATSSLLEAHDAVHRRHRQENAAVLGFITWHPRLAATPLMRFMERGGAVFGRFGGHQFAFDLLAGKEKADYRFFYTSNISLKSTLITRFKFDPWFSSYGWEDIELGYRLTKKAGLVLYYEPSAVAYHDHFVTDEQFARRMRAIGCSSHLMHKKYPELGAVPSRKKQFIFRLLGHPVTTAVLRPVSRNLYFYALSKKYFMEGLKEGYNEKRD